MRRSELLYMLTAWTVVSTMMFALALGFAGGLRDILSLPTGGPVSIGLAVIVWIFILFPAVAIPVVILRRPPK